MTDINPLAINFPPQIVPMVSPDTGQLSTEWWWVQQSLLNRTGGPSGISSSDVETIAQHALTAAGAAQTTANEALSDSETAQATANTAITDAAGAQTTATGAQSTATAAAAAVVAETARAEAAEALLAPQASPTFTGTVTTGGAGGPTWTTGSGVPATTQPRGSFYSRTGGGVGSTFYVSQGGGTWNPVAGV